MIFEGSADGTGLRIGIVVSRWNERVTRSLLDGALGALRRAGVDVDLDLDRDGNRERQGAENRGAGQDLDRSWSGDRDRDEGAGESGGGGGGGGGDRGGVVVAWVPGAWEIPLAASWMAESGRFAAVVCLGAVIRGETPHFDFIAGGAMRGIADVALRTGVPVSAGILTCDTSEQALERSGLKGGNKGAEAALAAVEMARLREKIWVKESK